MGFTELKNFGEEFVREVRDDSVSVIARYLAGRYGRDHLMAPCWQREMSNEHRLAIANAIVHTVDVALTRT